MNRRWVLPVAASLLIAGLALVWAVIQTSRPGWDVTTLAGQPALDKSSLSGKAKIRAGQWLETDSDSRALLDVGSIGRVEIGPDTRLQVRETKVRADRRVGTYERLAEVFFKTFPQLDDVRFTHAWGGPIALTTRMAVHFQRYHDGKAIYAGGYSGFGVSASRFGARLGLALLDDPDAPELKLDCASTLPNVMPPEPFRWIGAKLTMYALEDADEKGGWRRAWLRLVHAMGFPL